MRRHYGQTKAQRQAEWLAQFNDRLTALHPRLSGRVDWAAALHYFYSGQAASEAVDLYCLARNIPEEA